VCVCVCVCVKNRGSEKEHRDSGKLYIVEKTREKRMGKIVEKKYTYTAKNIDSGKKM